MFKRVVPVCGIRRKGREDMRAVGKKGRAAASGKMDGFGVLRLKETAAQLGIAILASAIAAALFYNSPWGMLILPAAYVLAGKYIKERGRRKRRERMDLEFKDYMHAVSAALAAGNSVERAFLRGLQDVSRLHGEQSALAAQLGCMERRLGLKEPIERILSDFAAESGSEDIENFVEVFCHAKRGGGDFIHIMATSVRRICDKMEVLEEIRSVMAEKALEQKVMCMAPLGVLLFFKLSSPEFIGRLYGNLLGVSIMTAALALYGAAFYMGMVITRIEV